MNKVVSDLESGLKNQTYDLSKNTGLAKFIKQYKQARDELAQQIDLEPITAENAAKVVKMGNKVADIYKKISQAKAKLLEEDDDVLRTLFPEKFSAKIDKGIKAINKFFREIDEKQIKKTGLTNLETDLGRLKTELTQLENRRIKIDIDADLSDARKKIRDFEEERQKLLKQVQEKLTPAEQVGADGKTASQRHSDRIQTSRGNIARKEQALSAAKEAAERKLTVQEQAELNALKARHEGRTNEYTVERNSVKTMYRKYADELATRRTASEMGVQDTGRERRKLGRLSSDELEQRMEEARIKLAQLEAENTAALKRIEEIKATPAKEKKNAVQNLQKELEQEREILRDAENDLKEAQTAREREIKVGQEQAEKFASGETVSGVEQADIDRLEKLNEELEKTGQLVADLQLEKRTSSFDTAEQKQGKIGAKKSQIASKELEIKKLKQAIQELEDSTTIDELFKKLNELNIPTDNIEKTEAGIKALKQSLQQMDSDTLKQVREALKNLGIEGEDAEDIIKKLTNALDDVDDSAKDINHAAQDMENLKQQILDFFSITNAVQLFKDTIRSALETVKELDATMTEAAVVTDFSISDMWGQLPRYSAEAQKLGVSINGMYQATTLYYQQGLKTNEAMELGVETMKMAKIAGMESADATKAMTSALRGFNMELNETSATRVNDVYSQLAAVTAADTSQIANAMEKTASIAAAANMEFETTAAFLAQIIETTQEAPETAGTAMKTIVARFSEVKSLASQGLVSGEDSEGEIIDVNKIQAALRTVGISMDEFFAGTEGLDSVLLKLAEKWETLDFETQRYIATMAAGSRQQSRFIAMMSDYGRTVELVDAANNSAGASQKQYEKTLDSLETALTKLKNAWDQFAMGLANNEILKFGVNLLTGLLESINKIIDTISGGNGLIKSVVSLGLAIAGLALGGKVLDAVFRSLGSSLAIGAGLKKTDADLTRKQAEASREHSDAQDIENEKQKETIRGLLEEIAARGLTTGVIKEKTAATKDLIESLFTEKMETLKRNAAMLQGVAIVAIYVAAIALAVAGIIKLVEAGKEAANANDKAIESMTNSIQEFSSQAQHAKEELNEIENSKNGLEQLQGTFSRLTKGTIEWKKNLAEINATVLNLVNKYPELAGYVSRHEGGYLTIDEAGWTAITESSIKQYEAAMSGQVGAQIRKTGFEEQKALEEAQSKRVQERYNYQEFINSKSAATGTAMMVGGTGAVAGALIGGAAGSVIPIVGTVVGALLGLGAGAILGLLGIEGAKGLTPSEEEITRQETGLSKKDYLAFAAAANEKGLSWEAGSTREEYRALFDEMKLEGDFTKLMKNIEELGLGFDKLGASAIALEAAEKVYTNSLIQQAADSNETVANSAYREQAETIAGEAFEGVEGEIQARADALSENKEYVRDGKATDKLIKQYANINKMTSDQVREQIDNAGLSIETMVTSVATNEQTNNMSKLLGDTVKKLGELTKAMGANNKSLQALYRVLSEGGGDITQDDVDIFKKINNSDPSKSREQVAKEYLKAQEFDDIYIERLTKEELVAIYDNLKMATSGFDKDKPVIDNLGLNTKNLTYKIVAGLADNFSKYINMGIDTYDPVVNAYNDIVKDLDLEQVTLFSEALGAIDWSNAMQVDDFSQSLIDLGFNMSEMGDKVNDLEKKIKAFTTASYKLSDAQRAAIVDKSDELIANVLEGRKTFTEEELSYLPEEIRTSLGKRGGKYYLKKDYSAVELAELIRQYNQERLTDTTAEEAFLRRQQLESDSMGYETLTYTDKVTPTELTEKYGSGDTYKYNQSSGEFSDDFWGNKTKAEFGEDFNTSIQGHRDIMRYYLVENVEGVNTLEQANEIINSEEVSKYIDDLYAFGRGMTKNQRGVFSAAANRYIAEYNQREDKSSLGWKQTFSELFTDVQTADKQDSQWGILERLFGAKADLGFQYEGVTEGEVLSDDDLKNLFMKVIGDGTVTDLRVMRQRLEAYYKDNLQKSQAFNEETLTQAMALGNYNDVYNLSQDETRADLVSQSAVDSIQMYANSIEGINEIVQVWKNNNADLVQGINGNNIALQTIALSLNKTEKNLRSLSTTLSDNIEALEKGPKAGMEYYAALEKVTSGLQMAFGTHITQDFVQQMIPKLADLAKGGETAAQAFYELSIAQAQLQAAQANLNEQEYADYAFAIQKLSQIDWQTTPHLNLNEFFTELNLMELSYDKFAEMIASNGLYTTLNIGIGDNTDDVISSLDFSAIAGNIFGDKGKEDKWENPYDVFYNTLAKINEAMREREKLERQYQRLMDRGDATGQKLVENLKLQTAKLQEEANLQRDIVKGRQQQMESYVANQGLEKYGWIDKNGEVRINWAEINKISDSEKGQEVEDYISQLEEWSESQKEAEDRLEEIEDEVHEINETGRDEYLDLEQEVADALRESYQKQIDELNNINESINDANSRLIAAMQSSIEKDRQARENEIAEEEIADKQARLAYLQQDTSGANALEAMQLEKEIAEEQENYTDSLIDQKISELQEQNDKAAEQRERQIEVAQAQLDQWFDNGDHWKDVYKLIQAGTDETGKLLVKSELTELLKEANAFEGMSEQSQMKWMEKTQSSVAAAWAWLKEHGKYLVDTKTGSSDNPDSGNVGASTQKKSTSPKTDNSSQLNAGGLTAGQTTQLQKYLANEGFYNEEDIDGKYGKKTKAAVEAYWDTAQGKTVSGDSGLTTLTHFKNTDYKTYSGGKEFSNASSPQRVFFSEGAKIKDENGNTHMPYYQSHMIPDANGLLWLIDRYGNRITNGYGPTKLGYLMSRIGTTNDYKAIAINRYQTGGLADYTGPAWLDGTKSKPELVLNARDTQNFIQLKDILASLMGRPEKTNENTGATSFDIDINVETINNESDLEMIAKYIENKITTSANYRNNTLIRGSR